MSWRQLDFRGRLADTEMPRRLGRIVFGDYLGLALFLGTLCYLAVLTRVGIFITDTYTTANAFVALTHGHLAVEHAVYGPSLATPGMHVVDGAHYGRNYGQLVLSLPAYWLLRGVGLVADLRIALVASWSLALLAFSLVVGRLLDYRREFALAGSALALVMFVANVAVATPLPGKIVPVLAMQLTSIVAGALTAVVAYRLVGDLTTRRTGTVAGVAVVLATPIGFWAPIPKRHVFTTLCVLVAMFAFARSRDPETPRRDLVHGGAYAATGLLAWIHAPEALVLFTALAVADVATSPPARYRALPTVIGVFLVSLLPFFVTNLLVSGNPFVPPRLLKVYHPPSPHGGIGTKPSGGNGGGTNPSGGGGTSKGGGNRSSNGASSGSSGGFDPLSVVYVLYDAIATATAEFVGLLVRGFETARDQSDQLYRTFVRSGYVAHYANASDEAINLSVLESAPILGGLVVTPLVAAVTHVRSRADLRELRQPGPATALAMGVFTVLFSLLYVERLPLFAQVTVRYLLPLYAVGVVGVVSLPPFRRVWEAHVRSFGWAVAGGVLLGGQVLTAVVVAQRLAIGEAFQFHALLGLGLAGAVVAGAIVGSYTERYDRAIAAILGLTTASIVVFSLLVVTAYSTGIGKYPVDGGQLLPIVRVLADLLTAA
ncbi:MAG: hypothetical protein ABEI57_00870 [Halapricum sp.]